MPIVPKFSRSFLDRYGNRIGQLEIKYIFLLIFLLGGLASLANSEAVLPAYLLGAAMAGFFLEQKNLTARMRTIAFSFLTPFYFLKAGLYVSFSSMATGAVVILALLLVKIMAKFIGVWPVTQFFKFSLRNGMYTTLLMSTGLTFGTISALFGLSRGLLNQGQYTVLVTVVILSAVVPTIIAQAFFRPATTLITLADK